jgi:tetratricopeptide (TPR) repeat protein
MTDMHNTSTSSAVPHDDPRLVTARQRLDRLDGYLRSDPRNNTMLIDAFETALSCQEWERAEFHLRHAQSLQTDGLAWQLREGDFWLAQERYDDAQSVLEALRNTATPPPGFADVVLHNLAFIDMRRGRPDLCIERLAPTLETSAQEGSSASGQAAIAERSLQQVWLRALHHDNQLDRAMTWSLANEQHSRLDPQVAGVAGLIAIDAADFAAAQRWSAMSLANGNASDHPVETFVTQASLALAERNAERARQFVEAALQRNPGDGRAWSTWGFAALLGGDFDAAVGAFQRSLAVMGQHVGTWHGLGWAQALQNRLPAARATFEAALNLDRNFAESHGGLAVVLAMQSDREKAQEHSEVALRLDPANVSGRYAQALLSGEVKDAKDLQRLARRLLGGRSLPLGGDMGEIFAQPKDGSMDKPV